MDEDLKIVALRLFAIDVDTLKRFYEHRGGYNNAVRLIVRRHARKLREKEAQEITPLRETAEGDATG